MMELESIIPVSPPIVNIVRNPVDHNIIGELVFNPFKVINHLKILILVGMAMIIVVDMK